MTTTVDNRTRDAVMHELEWEPKIDSARLAVSAHDGAIVLSGCVSSVTNAITLAPRNPPRVSDLEARVGDAIARLADLDARSMRITETGGCVQLHGHASSMSETRAPGGSAASAPQIMEVDNEIVVTPA